MGGLVIIFHAATHLHKPDGHDDLTQLFHKVGPDDKVDDPAFILQCNKANTLGRPGALADKDDACDIDNAAVLCPPQIGSGRKPARILNMPRENIIRK